MSRSEQAALTRENVSTVERELTALSRRLRNGARAIYEANGLTFTEYSLLRIIADEPGMTAAELVPAAGIDKSTASRQLTGLRTRGLLERGPDGRSPRGHALVVTPAALDTLEAIGTEVAAAIGRQLVDWSSDDVATFAALLRRYNSATRR